MSEEVHRRTHIGAVATVVVVFPLAYFIAEWRWALFTVMCLIGVGGVLTVWWAGRALSRIGTAGPGGGRPGGSIAGDEEEKS